MAPNQIIEVIAGNVSRNRVPLDINYNPILLGDENRIPTTRRVDSYIKSGIVDKRGMGYHFQLNTRNRIEEECLYNKNFVFALDKEGAFRLNVPKTSKLGNVIFPVSADFYTKGFGVSSSPNTLVPPVVPTPVVRQNGNSYSPPESPMNFRKTGIKYVGLKDHTESPAGESDVEYDGSGIRINPTMYHNMWACAERSIANSISEVRTLSYTTEDQENPIYQIPRNKPGVIEVTDFKKNGKKPRLKYSTIEVLSGKPAIHNGGGNYYGGQPASKVEGKPYSNSFKVEDQVIIDDRDTSEDPGGISGNINFEGSVITSIGKDNYDGKSMLMDCAGSLVSWIGADKNGRSLVTQTDGGVILEIGNPDKQDMYQEGKSSNGSLYIRVNVTSKGSASAPNERNKKGEFDDYIISVSEEGLVIWGANPNKPMIFRNAGNINIESTRGGIYLSAADKIYHKNGVSKFSDLRAKKVVASEG